MTEGMFNEGFAAGVQSFLEGLPEEISNVIEVQRTIGIALTTGDAKEDFAEGFVMGAAACIVRLAAISHGELVLNMAALWADSKYGSKDDLWEKFNGVG